MFLGAVETGKTESEAAAWSRGQTSQRTNIHNPVLTPTSLTLLSHTHHCVHERERERERERESEWFIKKGHGPMSIVVTNTVKQL